VAADAAVFVAWKGFKHMQDITRSRDSHTPHDPPARCRRAGQRACDASGCIHARTALFLTAFTLLKEREAEGLESLRLMAANADAEHLDIDAALAHADTIWDAVTGARRYGNTLLAAIREGDPTVTAAFFQTLRDASDLISEVQE
jgi:hypothetical protein